MDTALLRVGKCWVSCFVYVYVMISVDTACHTMYSLFVRFSWMEEQDVGVGVRSDGRPYTNLFFLSSLLQTIDNLSSSFPTSYITIFSQRALYQGGFNPSYLFGPAAFSHPSTLIFKN